MQRCLGIAAFIILSQASIFIVVCAADDIKGTSGTSAQVARPSEGTWSGTSAIVGFCADGTVHQISTGTGFSTLMGASGLVATFCFDPNSGFGTGNIVLTAANGDKVVLDISLVIQGIGQTEGTFAEAWTVSAGTGRFSGAIGSGRTDGSWVATSEISDTWVAVHKGEFVY